MLSASASHSRRGAGAAPAASAAGPLWFCQPTEIGTWFAYGQDHCEASQLLLQDLQAQYPDLAARCNWHNAQQALREERLPLYVTPAFCLRRRGGDEGVWLYGQQCWDWMHVIGGGAATAAAAASQAAAALGGGGGGRQSLDWGAQMMMRADRQPAMSGSGPGPGPGGLRRTGLGGGSRRQQRPVPQPVYTGGDLTGGSVQAASAWDGPARSATLEQAIADEVSDYHQQQAPEDHANEPPPPVSCKKPNMSNDLERRLQEFTAMRDVDLSTAM